MFSIKSLAILAIALAFVGPISYIQESPTVDNPAVGLSPSLNDELPELPSNLPPEWRVARAALRMITEGESRCAGLSAYEVMYGCRHFTDMSHHPDQCFPINLPGYEGMCSTAAGRYQFITTTWDIAVAHCAKQGIVVEDFTPTSQDLAAICLMARVGALKPLTEAVAVNPRDGSVTVSRPAFEQFLQAASIEWASMAYSDANQPILAADLLWDYFNQHLYHENFPSN